MLQHQACFDLRTAPSVALVIDALHVARAGVDPASLADSLRASAGWGSAPFRVMTWRKPELVHDLLLQARTAINM